MIAGYFIGQGEEDAVRRKDSAAGLAAGRRGLAEKYLTKVRVYLPAADGPLPHGDRGDLSAFETGSGHTLLAGCGVLLRDGCAQGRGDLRGLQQASSPKKITAARSIRLNLNTAPIGWEGSKQRQRHVHIGLLVLIGSRYFNPPVSSPA